ncbi:DUF3592 domain-containing protein [Pseudoruegeria sp. HB172150]|uniref:DUF3592 domain-containing protein n=1 Tax=Pseudoruegeria sp. HB172150 TaxID=2721164 RepID=UPI001C12F75B|nr:DUF3592 domain-containing protein [Pseudoruegeria sp. HB172150]
MEISALALELMAAPFIAVARLGPAAHLAEFVVLALATTIALVLLVRRLEDWIRSKRNRITEGRVVHIFPGPSGVAMPRIGFVDAAGVSHSFSSALPCTQETGRIGGRVSVQYDPVNPNQAQLTGHPGVQLAKAALIVAMLVAFAYAGLSA